MENLSPKIEIINHFDNLINRVDIDIEQSIKKYTENKDQVLGDLKCFSVHNRNVRINYDLDIEYFNSNESSENNKCEEVIKWSETTKVMDYLNQVRQRTIDELRKAQKDSLEYLKSNSCDLNHIKESKDIEEMKNRLFAEKFFFQVLFKHQDSWVFSLYTIAVDFYLSPSDINFLEFLINFETTKLYYADFSVIFDEKYVLIQSITKHLCENIKTQQYPIQLLSFRKQDLLNIKSINSRFSSYNLSEVNINCSSSNYFSKLENLDLLKGNFGIRVRIEGLLSLKSLSLKLTSHEESSFENLHLLKRLKLDIKSEINKNLLTKLIEIFPNIEELALSGQFSNVKFYRFVNLKKLSLSGDILNDFKFNVFKNIYNRLEELTISLHLDDKCIYKLLHGRYFPNLSSLRISCSKITKLEKYQFDGFPMLQSLEVCRNKQLETIEKDAFFNLTNLRKLVITFNDRLSELDLELFSGIFNLEELCLENNKFCHFDLNIMNYLVKIKKIKLYGFWKREEILDHFKQLKIDFSCL